MSKKRLILRVVLGLCAAVAVARLSVSMFPLHALVRYSPQNDDGRPVQVESGGEFLLHGREIAYPESAVKQRVEGLVVAEVTVDSQGQVIDARILSGPEQLRKTVLSSLLEWHFDASKRAAGTSQVAVRFRLWQEGRAENIGVAQSVEVRMSQGALIERLEASRFALEQAHRNGNTAGAEHAEREIKELEQALARGGKFELRTVEDNRENRLRERLEELERGRNGQGQPLTSEQEDRLKRQIMELKMALAAQVSGGVPGGVAGGVPGGVAGGVAVGVLAGIKMEGLSDATREALQGRLPVRIGDPFNETTLRQVRERLAAVDEHLQAKAERDNEGKYWLFIGVRE